MLPKHEVACSNQAGTATSCRPKFRLACECQTSDLLNTNGTSVEEAEHLNITSASAKIRLILLDRTSREEFDCMKREPNNESLVSETQIELLSKLKVAAETIMEFDRAQANELIAHELVEANARRDSARALPLASAHWRC